MTCMGTGGVDEMAGSVIIPEVGGVVALDKGERGRSSKRWLVSKI